MALTQISTAGVKDDAVTSGKIPANAVGSSELADNAVDTAAIADDAVTTAKIAAGNVTATELGTNAVTVDKIADNAVGAGELASNAVTTAKIADQAVTAAKIADNSITAAQLAPDSVSYSELGVNAVGNENINSGAISSGKMASNSIATAAIQDDAVTTAKIADDAVDTAQILNNAVTNSKLTSNAVTTAKIADEAVTLEKLPHGTATNDGKFLRANNNADPSYEAIPISARNLIINGDMRVAQRGTSSTSTGYKTVDRWQVTGSYSGTNTQSQGTVGYTTTPYDLGFRKSLKVTNGNHGSANASDNIEITYSFEGDEIATSGWDYVSSSKKITLSFWIKSSVAQTFYGYFRTFPNVDVKYSFPIVCSSTNWEYKTVSIVGESNFAQNVHNSFGNGTGRAMVLRFVPFFGTSYTDSNALNNAWQNYSAGVITPDYSTSWFLTNGATFELTGVQLEVGDSASDFAHRHITEEQMLCKRYYQQFGGSGDHWHFGLARAESDTARAGIPVPVPMRTSPTVTCGGSRTFQQGYVSETSNTPSVYDGTNRNNNLTDALYTIDFPGHNLTHNNMYALMSRYTGTDELTLDAEL